MKQSAALALLGGVLLVGVFIWSPGSGVETFPLSDRALAMPDSQFGMSAVPLYEVMDRLPNSGLWADFLKGQEAGAAVYIDPRSLTPLSLIISVPLIPGSGLNNDLSLLDLGDALGRSLLEVSAGDVAVRILRYVTDNRDLLAIAIDQLGEAQVMQVTEDLWQVSIPQQVRGVPVRQSRLVATIAQGNLVLLGTSQWGNASVSTFPTITPQDAVAIGFARAGGRQTDDVLWKEPSLEIIAYDPDGWSSTYNRTGAMGQGYAHRLVWVFGFERPGDPGRWEVMVEAQTGVLSAFQDVNAYVKVRR